MVTILIIVGILASIYGAASLIMGRNPNAEVKLPAGKLALVLGLALSVTLILGDMLIYRVGAQEVGVVVKPNGTDSEEMHTGLHVVLPWNQVHLMDKTVWVYTCAHATKEGQKADADAIWAPTKDGIKMGFDVSVSWKIIPDQASWIYENISENDGGNSGRYLWLEENVIRPKLKSAMALTVSEFTPIEAYSTKRQNIQDEVFKRMQKEVKGYRLVIDHVDMREVFYNEKYENAINNKKLAEQEVLRLVEVTKQKEEELKQASINKNIAIERSEGEAKALQIKGASIASNPKIISLEWINKWNGALPQYMMGNGQNVIMSMPNQ